VSHDAERDTYLVVDAFGCRLGSSWRETDAESADRAPLICWMLVGQLTDDPVRQAVGVHPALLALGIVPVVRRLPFP
jgi:hypothetical protein